MTLDLRQAALDRALQEYKDDGLDAVMKAANAFYDFIQTAERHNAPPKTECTISVTLDEPTPEPTPQPTETTGGGKPMIQKLTARQEQWMGVARALHEEDCEITVTSMTEAMEVTPTPARYMLEKLTQLGYLRRDTPRKSRAGKPTYRYIPATIGMTPDYATETIKGAA